MISIFSITPERAIQIDFSIPYAGQSAVVIAPKSMAIKGNADLVGKKVGLTRGTAPDGLLTAAAAANPGIEILRFDDQPALMQAMISGQIDAMGGGDYGEIYLKKAENGDAFEQKYVLKTFYFGIGVAKGNDNLRQWINTWLFTMKADGTLDALLMKYRNQPLPVLPVLAEFFLSGPTVGSVHAVARFRMTDISANCPAIRPDPGAVSTCCCAAWRRPSSWRRCRSCSAPPSAFLAPSAQPVR